MGVAAVSFTMASAIHFGFTVPLGSISIRDPFPGAAIPEGIIAVALALGVGGIVTRRSLRWHLALGTSLFAAALTLYGLTVTIRSSRTGDVAYHVGVLVILGLTVAILLLPAGRRI
jgi:hypothetical protein